MSSARQPLFYLQLAMAAGLLGYWVLFFGAGLAPDPAPECYFAYERAFPVPDALLALSLLCGAVLGARRDPRAARITVAAGGALIFLGLLDASFNLQSGVYAAATGDATFSLLVNLLTLAAGVACALTPR